MDTQLFILGDTQLFILGHVILFALSVVFGMVYHIIDKDSPIPKWDAPNLAIGVFLMFELIYWILHWIHYWIFV
jgi:hypothetical protein